MLLQVSVWNVCVPLPNLGETAGSQGLRLGPLTCGWTSSPLDCWPAELGTGPLAVPAFNQHQRD